VEVHTGQTPYSTNFVVIADTDLSESEHTTPLFGLWDLLQSRLESVSARLQQAPV